MAAQLGEAVTADAPLRRSLVAALVVDAAASVAIAVGLLALIGDPPAKWAWVAMVIGFGGLSGASAWLHRIGRALGRRDMRGLRFGRYGRQVLGHLWWTQGLAWFGLIAGVGAGVLLVASGL